MLLRLLRSEEGGLSPGNTSKHVKRAARHTSVAAVVLYLVVYTIRGLNVEEVTYRGNGGMSLSVRTTQQTGTQSDLPTLPDLPTP
jgi:hypothetical protein